MHKGWERNVNHLFGKIDTERLVNDTLELVRIPNTAGNTIDVAALYERLLKQTGLTVKTYELIPSNPTLVAKYEGSPREGKTLIFNGHMDVIPLEHEGSPYVKDGKIFGRGTCDMKGALACILEVVRVLQASKAEINGNIVIVANSMHESPGGRGEDLTALVNGLELQADAAVVMEGATYDCTVAQMGSATFNITIEREGEPSHQLFTPEGTPHPVTVAADVIRALNEANEKLAKEWIADIGYASYFIGNVHSGSFYNQMPNRAVLEGVRRYAPDQSFEQVKEEMTDLLNEVARRHGVEIHLDMKKVRDGYTIKKDDNIVKALLQAVKQVRGIGLPLVGKKLVTDAGIFVNGLGIPTVCYGPDQRMAHGEVEYVEISELQYTVKVYLQLIHEYLGIEEAM